MDQSDVASDVAYRVDVQGSIIAVDSAAPAYSRQRNGRKRRQSLAVFESVTSYNVPIHHSRSSSSKKLFLNFQGEVVTDSAWNWASANSGTDGGYSPITSQPFYGSGFGPHNHTESERNAITDIWMRVSEAFRPFDIDVTTDRPVRTHVHTHTHTHTNIQQ